MQIDVFGTGDAIELDLFEFADELEENDVRILMDIRDTMANDEACYAD